MLRTHKLEVVLIDTLLLRYGATYVLRSYADLETIKFLLEFLVFLYRSFISRTHHTSYPIPLN